MANTRFILNETSYFGFGAREVLLDELKDRGYKRVFLVSDKSLVDAGVTDKVINIADGLDQTLFLQLVVVLAWILQRQYLYL